MNYSNNEVVQALAAEYVLGTLRGRARDRFESLKATREDFQKAVWFWESKLNDMALEIEPTAPRAEVWSAISEKLARSNQRFGAQNSTVKVIELAPESRSEHSSGPWKWALGLSSAACFLLAFLLFSFNEQLQVSEQPVAAIAVFSNDQSQILWSVDVKKDVLKIKSTERLPQEPNNDYQLWIVPKSGDAPISIGLLPQKGEVTIKGQLALDYNDIDALAVSIEPIGGSPTGQPTKVLFAAELVSVRS